VWFFNFSKNQQFQFFKYSRIRKRAVKVLWKKFKIKERSVSGISKTLKNQWLSCKNWQQTDDSLPVFFTFSIF
jgi:hypothetical protein